MKYDKLPDNEKERIFAEGVLEIKWWNDIAKCIPLTNLNTAFLGVNKLTQEEGLYLMLENLTHKDHKWRVTLQEKDTSLIQAGLIVGAEGHTPNEAIVEACIRIKRPDLFEEDK